MAKQGMDYEHWSRAAAEWVTWARTPNHDAFWAYRSSLLEFIGPGSKGEALDVGCGEGRVSRVLKECGYRVTATDPVEAFVAAAEQAGSAVDYKVVAVANLPFPENTFDLVVTYNVLMDVDDVPAALREIGRVLRPAGTLIIAAELLVHPLIAQGTSGTNQRLRSPGKVIEVYALLARSRLGLPTHRARYVSQQ